MAGEDGVVPACMEATFRIILGPMDRKGFFTGGRWLPAALFIVIAALVLLLWHGLEDREQQNLKARIEAEADYLGSHVEADLRSRLPALQRLARSWEIHGGLSEDEFSEEATTFILDAPGFQALEWADASGIVRWVAPLEGNEKAKGLDLSFEKSRREAFQAARSGKEPTLSQPLELVQGGMGLLAFYPTLVAGRFEGSILAVFQSSRWFDYVFSVKSLGSFYATDRKVAVLLDGAQIYMQAGFKELEDKVETASARTTMLGHDLTVQVRPTEAFIRRNRTSLPAIVAAAGFVLALLISIIAWLMQRERLGAERSRRTSAELETALAEKDRLESQLRRALSRIDLATQAGRMGIWTWHLADDRLTWNERMFDLFGVPADVSPTYATWRDAVHPDDVSAAEFHLNNAVLGKEKFDTEFRIVMPDGEVRNIRAAARVERDAMGKAEYVTGINWDMTEARRAVEGLRKKEEEVRLLLNSTAEAIYGIDLEGNCTFANPACARLLGYPDVFSFLGRNMHRLIHYAWPDSEPMPIEDCNIFKAFREGKGVHVDNEVLWKADGTSFPVEYWSYPQVQDGKVMGAVVTFIDISDRLRAVETIRHMATHDTLTDLPTLRLYRDRLTMAMRRARRNGCSVAVLFVDLDGFKSVNDTYGHDAGDAVLREVAGRLGRVVRDTDTVARAGGDEFVLVLADLQARENASGVAAKTIESLAQPINVNDRQVLVGASVGIALFPADGSDVDGLIKAADTAMYEVKRAGKNGYRFAGDGDKSA